MLLPKKGGPDTAAGVDEATPLLVGQQDAQDGDVYADESLFLDARLRSVSTHLRIARLAAYSATAAMFAIVLALFAAIVTLPFGHHRAGHDADSYGGKTLAPANYTVVPGLFVQSDPGFNATGYDMLQDSFGLLDKSAGRWKNFTKCVSAGLWVNDGHLTHPDRSLQVLRMLTRRFITSLNEDADEHTTYKVIFIARHGQGWHNVAESQYGTPAWNCYWSLLDGDGKLTWVSENGTCAWQPVNGCTQRLQAVESTVHTAVAHVWIDSSTASVTTALVGEWGPSVMLGLRHVFCHCGTRLTHRDPTPSSPLWARTRPLQPTQDGKTR